MAIRKGRSIEESTRWKGGYYALPQNKNPKNMWHQYGYNDPSAGFYESAFQNAHYQRVGKYGNKGAAKEFASLNKKDLKSSGLAVGAITASHLLLGSSKVAKSIGSSGYYLGRGLEKAGAGKTGGRVFNAAAQGARHTLTSHPRASLVTTGIAFGALGYGTYKQHQAHQLLRKETGTRESLWIGYHSPKTSNTFHSTRKSLGA